jgi:hypothetical protein
MSVAACTDGPGVESISLTKFSRAICEKQMECGCAPLLGQLGYVPPLACEGWNFEDLRPPSADEGYDDDGYDDGSYDDGGYEDDGDDTAGGEISHAYDQACADRLAAAIAAMPCEGLIPDLDCDDYCKIVYGTRFEGQPCRADVDCAQGLRCFGECRDPCAVTTVGEGESCQFATCDVGLTCTGIDEGPPICVPQGGIDVCDEPCTSMQWCDAAAPDGPTCRARGEPGAPCMGHAQCVTSYCPAGFCEELPGDGEPCTPDGECRDGALCVFGTTDAMPTCVAVAPACVLTLLLIEDT